ncbi:hypothetical protein GLOIN_2v1521868 [Rhizophagus clarus]|uniref:Uncharacterized protein n=1 Tax=Rhizophagus clarus TaxID=94130 RepID=A0A8H3R0S3_9GLOM|nr:hypothetical protein GLOIN_2v1521868 [Rhizophagus clarus]
MLFDNKRTFFYEIIKEGTYPLTEQLYYTRYPKHPIPHNYIVRTQYGKAKHIVECSIEYVEKKPLYKVYFGINFAREVQSWESTTDAACKYYREFNEMGEMDENQNRNQSNKENNGKMSGPLLFGLKLLSVEQVRRTMSLDHKIRLFNDLGNSQKRRKILGLSQYVLDIVEKEKGNTFHPDDQIKLKQIKFETYDDSYNINFGKLDRVEETKKIEAIVKSLDKGHISREAYRSLARIEDLPREKVVYDMRQKINVEVKKKVPITLVDLSQPSVFEPITEEPDIIDGAIILNMLVRISWKRRRSILHIRISGDGHNVGRKLKHVMITMTLLNDLDGLQKPDNHYTLVLYPGAETYESLKNALTPLISDLCILKERGFKQTDGSHWPVEFKNDINTTSKTINKSMDNIKANYNQINGHIREPLFHMISLKNWVVDELHIFLRITDRLWELMISDLCRETTDEEAKSWLDAFTAPSIGHPNRSDFVRGMYRVQDLTPYIHVLCNHVAEFLEIHHKFGLSAFSCSAVEKKNHMQVCLYFQNTLKDGGNKNSQKSAILEMLEHENRQLYFDSNSVPSFLKKSKKYRLQ